MSNSIKVDCQMTFNPWPNQASMFPSWDSNGTASSRYDSDSIRINFFEGKFMFDGAYPSKPIKSHANYMHRNSHSYIGKWQHFVPIGILGRRDIHSVVKAFVIPAICVTPLTKIRDPIRTAWWLVRQAIGYSQRATCVSSLMKSSAEIIIFWVRFSRTYDRWSSGSSPAT